MHFHLSLGLPGLDFYSIGQKAEDKTKHLNADAG